MSNSCRLLCGFLMSFVGWIGIIIATSTNDWVLSCTYGSHSCRNMDDLETKGLWTECVISTALYHCIPLNQVRRIPAYIQACRVLMVSASLLGLPALALLLLAMPCVKVSQETEGTKHRRAVQGGLIILVISLCGMVSTVWFPIGKLDGLMSFGFSLYAGWVGSALCFFAGSVMVCCSKDHSPSENPESRHYYSNPDGVTSTGPSENPETRYYYSNHDGVTSSGTSENQETRFYYSNHDGVTSYGPAKNSHAKSEHV
ncbi:claudin-11b [Danio rerio]|uniref:Claudin-11b n=1 Tax=Danio rerio TaxID=7955 RepID=A4QNU3_DANRE|nr:claudin-11b [Danio rerio]AAI39524.1 Cldn11 protein [Danio rerio]|eukprot:NP_571847.2 claudin-11 [Danio rerio]